MSGNRVVHVLLKSFSSETPRDIMKQVDDYNNVVVTSGSNRPVHAFGSDQDGARPTVMQVLPALVQGVLSARLLRSLLP